MDGNLVDTISTEANRRLSELIQNRATADAWHVGGRIQFWRLTGIGLVALGIGAAIGIGCYGYSYVTRSGTNLIHLSQVLAQTLSHAELRGTAEGTVRLEPREVALAKGQTISLDPASRLRLDPGARVFADGEIRIQAPSVSTLSPNAQARSTSPTITNFTVFKRVLHEKGAVMTGWMFLTSAQKLPTEEYCYYTEDTKTPGLNVVLNLGVNGRLDSPRPPSNDFDIMAAFSKCVWFRNVIP